jgi:hypothetical protein
MVHMSQTSAADVNTLVAANLRAEIARSNLQQRAFAPVLDLSPAQVSARFNGRVPLTIGELAVIASHAKVSLARLLAGIEIGMAVPA